MKSVDLLFLRVTITLDPRLNRRIGILQARKLLETQKPVNFSNVVNDLLKIGLKHYGDMG